MKAYERFLQYVTVHTTSDENSGTHPSFAGEFDLARMLEKELKELGVPQVTLSDSCYVYGFLPATDGCEKAPALAFLAHMDTSPDAAGIDVKPIVRPNYDGEDVELPGSGAVMELEQFPFLMELKGETLITSDGTTLLGADDKAGIAEILTALEEIQTEKLPHGPLWIIFTPDEEIGEGVDCFDHKLCTAKYAYTVDGGDSCELEYENFNAAGAKVRFKGFSVHPGSAKNIMVNAQNLALEFHGMLPPTDRPETTEGREGFFHLTDMKGNVSEAELSYIIRDHDREIFEKRKQYLNYLADSLNRDYGEGTVTVTIRDSYYNMLEKIRPHMHLIENARLAMQQAGLKPRELPIRGGTDGARLSFEGLPCPNLGTGGFNFHGNFECITAERMDRSKDVIKNLIALYAVREES